MRTKRSIINATVKLFQGIFPNVLVLLLNQRIIEKFGSDVNGVLTTASQIINMLTIFDSGFVMSAVVVLYVPYMENDTLKINAILTATKKMLSKIGSLIAILGALIAGIAPFFLKSSVDPNIIRSIFLVSVANIVFSFLFSLKYSIMYSVSQKEYKQSIVTIIFQMLAQLVCLTTIANIDNPVLIRLLLYGIPIIGFPITFLMHRKDFGDIGFTSDIVDKSGLAKAKDVFVQKFAVLAANSSDALIISTLLSASLTSVYSIYYFIYSGIKQMLFAFALAPFNAFGQLIASKDERALRKNYRSYVLVTLAVVNALITTTNQLVIPFVVLYSRKFNDAQYSLPSFALFFSICTVLEIISNMIGVVLNSGGWFGEVKPIILISTIIKISLSIILIPLIGLYAVLFGTFVSYLVMDIGLFLLLRKFVLGDNTGYVMKYILVNISISIVLTALSLSLVPEVKNYFQFALAGVTLLLINSTTIILGSFAMDKNEVKNVFKKVLAVFGGRGL